MSARDRSIGGSGGHKSPQAVTATGSLKVFINYRHEDTDAAALLLYDRLAGHFGAQNVFLDVKTLEIGTRWLEEIKSHAAVGGAFLALIGRTWLANLKDRQHVIAAESEDFVVLELEFALRRWPGRVIPVLVGGATVPTAVRLPRPIRALAACQAVELRSTSFDQDTESLIAKLDALATVQANDASGSLATDAGAEELKSATSKRRHQAEAISLALPTIPRPDEAHYDILLECMVDEGTVVPVLGSRVRGRFPDAEQLATHLSNTFRLGPVSLDLAEVAQHIAVTKGPSFLYRAMKDALRVELEPNDLHRFLARFPKRLDELDRPARYQMIVTTNFDTALERAFEAESEPYDLAVFIAGGTDKGKFLHVPWRGRPELITEPSKYRAFPIDPYDELERTVVVKILGASDGAEGDYRWDRSYVLTEDQYIDYLVTDQIGSVVPLQILNKLTSSHCLFLGYAMRDWSLRVFLKRIWQGMALEDKSWAIEHEPDALEKDFWNSLRVELLAASPDDYANELDARLGAWRDGDE